MNAHREYEMAKICRFGATAERKQLLSEMTHSQSLSQGSSNNIFNYTLFLSQHETFGSRGQISMRNVSQQGLLRQ